jgi:membrane associated rhomboid family serine protease
MRATAVKGLIIANVAVFVIQIIMQAIAVNKHQYAYIYENFLSLFAMVPEYITTKFYFWQFVTAMFLHDGLWHIFFNMLGLFFFGPELEALWGKRRFLKFYFIVGILANVFAYLLNIHVSVPTIGASGAVFALLGAFGALYPDVKIIVYIFPVKIKYFLAFSFIYATLGMLGLEAPGIAHGVHFAGIVLGVAYVKLKWRAFDDFKFRIKERLRLWRLRRKYRNFKIVDSEVKQMWDDLEDKINDEGHNKHIN